MQSITLRRIIRRHRTAHRTSVRIIRRTAALQRVDVHLRMSVEAEGEPENIQQ
ncbi:MAG: hypothetical protein JST89_21965 [Cyanobacteria bacterium SZAS-4]|nr:hypothetical protein [Cyanobacteria bacterium SZAS-4]